MLFCRNIVYEILLGPSKEAYCNYSIISLRKNAVPALESVPLESIKCLCTWRVLLEVKGLRML